MFSLYTGIGPPLLAKYTPAMPSSEAPFGKLVEIDGPIGQQGDIEHGTDPADTVQVVRSFSLSHKITSTTHTGKAAAYCRVQLSPRLRSAPRPFRAERLNLDHTGPRWDPLLARHVTIDEAHDSFFSWLWTLSVVQGLVLSYIAIFQIV